MLLSFKSYYQEAHHSPYGNDRDALFVTTDQRLHNHRFERKGKQYLISNFDLPLSNLFIYQARESSLVPRGFFDSSVSSESVIYEAFLLGI